MSAADSRVSMDGFRIESSADRVRSVQSLQRETEYCTHPGIAIARKQNFGQLATATVVFGNQPQKLSKQPPCRPALRGAILPQAGSPPHLPSMPSQVQVKSLEMDMLPLMPQQQQVPDTNTLAASVATLEEMSPKTRQAFLE